MVSDGARVIVEAFAARHPLTATKWICAELEPMIAAALAREAEARVRAEGERDEARATDLFSKILARAEQAERELAGVRGAFTAMEVLRMQTRDALVRQSARIAALEAALEAIERHIPPDLLDQFGVLALLRKALAPPERSR